MFNDHSNDDREECLLGLPSDNVQYELQRWSLIKIRKEEKCGSTVAPPTFL